MSMLPYWLTAAVSIVELDASSVGQLMISRPIVVGPCLGFFLGGPEIGLLAGALVELLGLEELPVGGRLPINGTVAVSSGLLLALGPAKLPLAASLPAGLFLGGAHAWGESFLKQGRAGLCSAAEKSLSEGKSPRFDLFALRSLLQQACWTALLLASALVFLGPALDWAWSRSPQAFKAGFDFGLRACPSLAAASLLCALWVKK